MAPDAEHLDWLHNRTPGLRRWWVSWYADDPSFEYHGPWWVSGSELNGPIDNITSVPIIVAAVLAPSREEAVGVIVEAHDNQTVDRWRFESERPEDWSPFSDRFRRADWMQWPE